jgi:hypothetical protein
LATIEFNSKALARLRLRLSGYDLVSAALIVALIILAVLTFHDYAISNDEPVQHHYGELIIAYYQSWFADKSVFNFENLYLYGGLFDVVAVWLSHVFTALAPFELRHIMCALIGIAGICAAAATARLIGGPRAGLIAAVTLAVCGTWYGAMFNHTKDIPLAAAMTGATFFLIRASRDLPTPRLRDVIGFGLLTGAALGIKVIGLLLFVYLGAVILFKLPRPLLSNPRNAVHFVLRSAWAFAPALLIAYVLMIAAWPWAALSPLNPVRGLFDFAEFHYHIPALLAGTRYEMATVPRWYVPVYILVKLPLLTLVGAALAIGLAIFPRFVPDMTDGRRRRETAFVAFITLFPIACEVVYHGPAFTGLRHFLFVVPLLSVLAGIAFDRTLTALDVWRRDVAVAAGALIAVLLMWTADVLVRLHPYEYVFYNQLVGGLAGAAHNYETDYWVNIMPEAVSDLDRFMLTLDRRTVAQASGGYTVAVCGERLPFEKRPHPYLRWTPDWQRADFFIAPTNMNCDRVLSGRVIATISRMGVPIGVVKDRRAITRASLAQVKVGTPEKTTQ